MRKSTCYVVACMVSASLAGAARLFQCAVIQSSELKAKDWHRANRAPGPPIPVALVHVLLPKHQGKASSPRSIFRAVGWRQRLALGRDPHVQCGGQNRLAHDAGEK